MSDALILVVEDDERNRKLVRDVLGASGYTVIEADRAEDGIIMARDRQPRLIIMDYRLPAMNGVEAMAVLQSDPLTRNIPVIAITASAMPEDREKLLAAGFRAYRPKPIRVRELLELVEEVIDSV